MFTYVETALTDEAEVRNWGTDGKALAFGNVVIVMQSPDDCDEVIRAAGIAKRRMLDAAERRGQS